MANWKGTPNEMYRPIQKAIRKTPLSDKMTQMFISLAESVLMHLGTLNRMQLISKVEGKAYFAFENDQRHSRSINAGLFADNDLVQDFLDKVLTKQVTQMSADDITKAVYTLVVGFAAVVDLLNPNDRQTPGCLYEYLVTHLLSRAIGAIPSGRVDIPIDNESIQLTLDLVLDLGDNESKYHVAIKNSTRERASEFWAHQRILDNAYGMGVYTGLFVGLAETKLNHRNLEVVEICVPDQWRAYQAYIAEIKGLYYLDPPQAYLALNDVSDKFNVQSFGAVFSQIQDGAFLAPAEN